jgi:cytosine/creatinine deaminase
MQVGRYIADLNHDRHAISILACAAHVKGTSGRFAATRLREYKMSMTSPLDYAAMLAIALQEARTGLAEGGIPIGAAIFDSTTGKLVGSGHNRRVQQGDPSVHGETDAFRNAGRQRSYRHLIMVTTLAPCWYCSGLVRQFGFGTVVVGESRNFQGGIDWLRSLDIKVIDLDSAECATLLADYIRAHPAVWNEDIGEE